MDEAAKEPAQTDGQAIEAARTKRVQLKAALSHLETALSGPTGEPEWRPEVRIALDETRDALEDHIDEVEGDDGLLAEVTHESPRLVHRVNRLVEEHTTLRKLVQSSQDVIDQGQPNDTLRTTVTELMFQLVQHRQAGADLVYDAYSVDIGGG